MYIILSLFGACLNPGNSGKIIFHHFHQGPLITFMESTGFPVLNGRTQIIVTLAGWKIPGLAPY